MSRATAASLVRGGAFAAAGIAFPFVVHAAWIVNIGVLTLMYATLATAWNLFSGYTGYISLGQVAFFGLGAYTLGISFEHFGIGSGYNPLFALPLVGAGVALAVCWIVLRSKLGLMLLAIREDEEKARGLGVRVTGAKLVAWWLSIAITAMAGGVWAYYLTFIYPESAVDPLVMIGAVLMTFLGGRGTLWGPAIGAFVLVPAQQYLLTRLGASELYLVGYSAVFMVVLLVLPRGILPSLRDAIERTRERRRTHGKRITRREAAA